MSQPRNQAWRQTAPPMPPTSFATQGCAQAGDSGMLTEATSDTSHSKGGTQSRCPTGSNKQSLSAELQPYTAEMDGGLTTCKPPLIPTSPGPWGHSCTHANRRPMVNQYTPPATCPTGTDNKLHADRALCRPRRSMFGEQTAQLHNSGQNMLLHR